MKAAEEPTYNTQPGQSGERAMLGGSSAPARQQSETAERRMADAVGAAVYVEQDPMSLASGDEIAAAPSTGAALGVMAFYVAADLLTTT